MFPFRKVCAIALSLDNTHTSITSFNRSDCCPSRRPRSWAQRFEWLGPWLSAGAALLNDDDEVKRRTGFLSVKNLLAYTIIVCNGDHNLMTYRSTDLTWFEEWFFFYELLWGRTFMRWWDAEKSLNKHNSSLKRVFCFVLGFWHGNVLHVKITTVS